MKMCMMNMMGHPMKLDILKLFRDAAGIFNEDVITKIPERISGDRFIGRLAMKTGSSMQYLLRIDAMLIKFFGSTLLDMIQTLALEISKMSDKELNIPPGQLINLVIEALDDKIETIRKGKMDNILPVHTLVISALGTDFTDIQLGVVKKIMDTFLEGGRDFHDRQAFQEILNLYEGTSFCAREGQRYLLKLLQKSEMQNKKFITALTRHLFDGGHFTQPVSYTLGGDPKLWGWVLKNKEMLFEPLTLGQTHFGTGCKPNLDGSYVQVRMPFWGNFLVQEYDASNEAVSSDVKLINEELRIIHDFLTKSCEKLNGGVATDMARMLRTLFRESGCPFLVTQLKGFSVEFRSLISGIGAITSSHISHENLRDSFAALLFHVREFTPEGISGLNFDQLMLAGSCACSPSTCTDSNASGDEGLEIKLETEEIFAEIGSKLLQKAKRGGSKVNCSRKLHL